MSVVNKRMKKYIDESIENLDKMNFLNSFFALRKALEIFSYGLLYEGLAEYAGKLPPKSANHWENTYRRALENSNKIVNFEIKRIQELARSYIISDDARNNLKVEMEGQAKSFREAMYPIGFHMVYTISFNQLMFLNLLGSNSLIFMNKFVQRNLVKNLLLVMALIMECLTLKIVYYL